jgi:2-polyprenyl-3-methyl-5-hydroxy-6-metoxy-1,4-benzoquinol methylase
MTMTSFKDYARYYELFYQDKLYTDEAIWFTQGIQSFAPTAKTLLDLGCGTGSYSRLLAQEGFEVLGVDQSQDMIDFAQKAEDTSPTTGFLSYKTGDARTLLLATPVDVITALFHVISYLTQDTDIEKTLACCARNLRPQGLLCFDVWHQEAVLTQQPSRREKRVKQPGFVATRKATPIHDKAKHTVTVHYDITIEEGLNRIELTDSHVMRYFSRDELTRFLNAAGFNLLDVREPLTNAAPSAQTWSVTYYARKN